MICLVWFGTVWFGIVCFGMVCWDIVWCGLVLSGIVWQSTVLSGMVWFCDSDGTGRGVVWWQRQFMPDSVSLVRLELGKFSADESRSIS